MRAWCFDGVQEGSPGLLRPHFVLKRGLSAPDFFSIGLQKQEGCGFVSVVSGGLDAKNMQFCHKFEQINHKFMHLSMGHHSTPKSPTLHPKLRLALACIDRKKCVKIQGSSKDKGKIQHLLCKKKRRKRTRTRKVTKMSQKMTKKKGGGRGKSQC